MGYRMGIEKIKTESLFYGTKLYGYVSNLDELESIKWLKEKCFIDSSVGFECNGEMNIVMKVYEFREFVKLYNFDYNKYEKQIEEDLKNLYPDRLKFIKDSFINDEKIQEILKMDDFEKLLLTWG